MPSNNDKPSHILNTSSNLLGLCFIVLTSIKVLNLKDATIIDEIATLAIVMFMISCILSFLSMRKNETSNNRLEKVADVFSYNLVRMSMRRIIYRTSTNKGCKYFFGFIVSTG